MRRLLLLTFSLGVFLPTLAQTDSTQVVSDSVAMSDVQASTQETVPVIKPTFFQASISIDYGKIGTTIAGLNEKYEGGVTFLFWNKFFLQGEYGVGILEPENAFRNGSYTSDGSYYRVGLGYLSQFNPTNRLGIGMMYGSGTFDDRGSVVISSPSEIQEDYVSTFSRSGLSAQWVEVILISEKRIILNKDEPEKWYNDVFSVGFSVRARFLTSYNQFSPIDVYSIPGYGRTVNSPNMALNLFFKIYIF